MLTLPTPTLVPSPHPDPARASRLRSCGTRTTPRATRAPPPRSVAFAPAPPRRPSPSPPPSPVASLAPPPPPRRPAPSPPPPVFSLAQRLSLGAALNGRMATVVAAYGRLTIPRAPLSWPLHHRKVMIKSDFRLAARITSSACINLRRPTCGPTLCAQSADTMGRGCSMVSLARIRRRRAIGTSPPTRP